MARPIAPTPNRPRATRSWASVGRGPAGDAANPPASLSERQAQYAAWKARLMQRDEVIVLDEPAPSRWSVDALFADLAASS